MFSEGEEGCGPWGWSLGGVWSLGECGPRGDNQPSRWRPLQRSVRILVECILVIHSFYIDVLKTYMSQLLPVELSILAKWLLAPCC